jgi:hypothetical protein
LRRVKGFRRAEIATLAQRNFHPASTVVSDGLHCFTGVGNAGCVHQPIITGSGRKAALNPAFKWVNTTLGNIKSAITGTYRTICRIIDEPDFVRRAMIAPNIAAFGRIFLIAGPPAQWTASSLLGGQQLWRARWVWKLPPALITGQQKNPDCGGCLF